MSTTPDLLDTASAVGSSDAVWRHLCQLTRDELAGLSEPEQLSSADQERWEKTLLVHRESGGFCRRPEVEELWPRVRDQLEAPAKSVPAVEKPSPSNAEVDIPSVFGHLEDATRLVGLLGREPFVGPAVLGEKHFERLSVLSEVSAKKLPRLLDFCQSLGLIEHRGGLWRPRLIAAGWLDSGAASKWRTALECFHHAVPSWWPTALPSPVTVDSVTREVAKRFPLVDPPTVSPWLERAEWLGLVRNTQATELSLAETSDTVASEIEKLVPLPVDQLYPDGPDTLVAAGPLSDQVEAGMRRVGQWLSGSLAPRFRMSPHTVVEALQSGWTLEDIEAFLERHVLGGAQSSVGDMVRDTATKAFSLSITQGHGGSVLRAHEPLTIRLLQADRRLAEARWELLDELTLRSPRSSSELHVLLLEEGYPHLIVDEHQHRLSTEPAHTDLGSTPAEWGVDFAGDVLDYWARQRNDSHWWTRVVELALSSKTTVRIVVEVDGAEHSLSMAPQSLSNGRLRGVDTRSDVERTIPLSHVRSVEAG